MSGWFETASGQRIEVVASATTAGTRAVVRTASGEEVSRDLVLRQAPNGDWLLESGGVTRTVQISQDRDLIWLTLPAANGLHRATLRLRRVQPRDQTGVVADRHLCAPMTGRVVMVGVQVGDAVLAGRSLVIVEAMKMEHAVRAPRAGTVERVLCHAGQVVEAGAELVVLAEESVPAVRVQGETDNSVA